MKKSLSIYGLCTGLVAVLGLVFKALQWSGGAHLLMAATPLIIIFLILYGAYLCKNENNSKFIVWLNALVLILMTLTGMFKILQWPGGGSMVLISGLAAIVDFIITLIYIIKK